MGNVPILVPRATWHPGPPTNNDGSPRPLLVKPLKGLAIHYTGSPIRARNSVDSATVFMTNMQRVAQLAGKSFEYNDIVPPRADGSSQVWEYAGPYRAAHAGSANNGTWWAIQVAIGVDNHPSYATYDKTKPTIWQGLSDAMVNAIQWRRKWLVDNGFFTANHEVREHRQLDGAATTCPGDAVRDRWADVLEPWTPPEEPDVIVFKTAADSLTIWASSDGLTAVRLEQWQCDARGINPGAVAPLSEAEQRKFVFLAGLPNLSVK